MEETREMALDELPGVLYILGTRQEKCGRPPGWQRNALIVFRGFSWLLPHRRAYYSQFGEDGLVGGIFQRLEPENHWCLEVGAADGLCLSNTRRLIEEGWTGILVEPDDGHFDRLLRNCRGHDVHLFKAAVGVRNGSTTLDQVMAECGCPHDLDFMSIDVDGQDYWLWNSLIDHAPRILMVEIAPDFNFTAPVPPVGGKGQAGFNAFHYLACGKGYLPVAWTYNNCIFARNDVFPALKDDEHWPEFEKPGLKRLEDTIHARMVTSSTAQKCPEEQAVRQAEESLRLRDDGENQEGRGQPPVTPEIPADADHLPL